MTSTKPMESINSENGSEGGGENRPKIQEKTAIKVVIRNSKH